MMMCLLFMKYHRSTASTEDCIALTHITENCLCFAENIFDPPRRTPPPIYICEQLYLLGIKEMGGIFNEVLPFI